MPNSIPTFLINGQAHRLIRRRRLDRIPGYLDPFDVDENVLQRRRTGLLALLSPWEDVEVEEIPTHVLISLGTLGDTGGWVSRFASRYPQAFA